jgi:hypothetical protein
VLVSSRGRKFQAINLIEEADQVSLSLLAKQGIELNFSRQFLDRLGTAGGAQRHGERLADRFGESDQTVARRDLCIGSPATSRRPLTLSPAAHVPAPNETDKKHEGSRKYDCHDDARNGRVFLPRLRAQIRTRGYQAPGRRIVHVAPRRAARLLNSSIRGTIGSASVVMVNPWIPELAHQR